MGVGVQPGRRPVLLENWDEASKYNEEARRLNPPDRAAKLVLNTATDSADRGRARR